MSTSFPTQGYHVVYMCPDVIFQILPPCSRPMMSHHVTCHVTIVSRASSLSKRKRKEKENQYKIRKIKEKKKKIVSVQASYNSLNIMTNQVASQSDLNIIKNYIKNIDVIKSEDIMTP